MVSQENDSREGCNNTLTIRRSTHPAKVGKGLEKGRI